MHKHTKAHVYYAQAKAQHSVTADTRTVQNISSYPWKSVLECQKPNIEQLALLQLVHRRHLL